MRWLKEKLVMLKADLQDAWAEAEEERASQQGSNPGPIAAKRARRVLLPLLKVLGLMYPTCPTGTAPDLGSDYRLVVEKWTEQKLVASKEGCALLAPACLCFCHWRSDARISAYKCSWLPCAAMMVSCAASLPCRVPPYNATHTMS